MLCNTTPAYRVRTIAIRVSDRMSIPRPAVALDPENTATLCKDLIIGFPACGQAQDFRALHSVDGRPDFDHVTEFN
jgi:hypothetical protein